MDSIKNINYIRILKGIIFTTLFVFYALVSMIVIPVSLIPYDGKNPATSLIGFVPMASFLLGWYIFNKEENKYKKTVGLILMFWILAYYILF